MYKLQKYSLKFNENNNLLYIRKFLKHKYNLLNGGSLDSEKIKLIEEFQQDINSKCTQIFELKHKPIEGPERFKKIIYNNNYLIDISNQLVFKKYKNETTTLICNRIYKIIINLNIKILKENRIQDIQGDRLNINYKNDLIYDKSVILSFNNSLKDIKIKDNIIFNYILYDYPDVYNYISEHIKDFIINLISKKKEDIEKTNTSTDKKLKIYENNIKLLDIILQISLENINTIVTELKQFLIEEIFVDYGDKLDKYKDMLFYFSQISSQKAVKEIGQFFSKKGIEVEQDIFKYLNNDNKYDNILFSNINGRFEHKKDIKGEFDLIIGDFDNESYKYDIKKIFDIKRSANLINDDIDKLNNAVNLINEKNIELLKKGVIYNKSESFIPIDYKGYIYINELSYADLSFQIYMNINKFIHKFKEEKRIDELLLIFELFKKEIINDVERPVIYIDDIKEKFNELYLFIKEKYDEENIKLSTISKNFNLYQCKPSNSK